MIRFLDYIYYLNTINNNLSAQKVKFKKSL